LLSGKASIDWMQIVNSSNIRRIQMIQPDPDWLDGYWLMSTSTDLDIAAKAGERLGVNIRFHGSIWFTLPDEYASETDQVRRGFATLRRAEGTVLLGDIARPAFLLSVGYFPVDYAPQSRILGNYLYRSGTYPGWVISGDEEPRVVGMRLSREVSERWRHDILLTSEFEYKPLYDLSLSYLIRFIGGPVEIGAGVELDHFWSVNLDKTYPKTEVRTDLINKAWVDTTTQPHDTTWYSHAGTKVMLRTCVDFKKLLPSHRLGEDDLKLYAEAAVLGVRNYRGFYEDITERVPVMAGFNLPAFKLLDVLAVELEYYGSPYKNEPSHTGYAIPIEGYNFMKIDDPAEGAGDKGKTDNIRWALHAARTFGGRIEVLATAASDHFRAVNDQGLVDPIERLHAPDEWYWKVGFSVRF
jgi:hypothetical protein